MSQTWKKVLLSGSNTPTDIQGGAGSSGQVLTTNGGTTLSWSNKTVNTDSNTTYSAGTNMSLSGTVFSATDTNTNTWRGIDNAPSDGEVSNSVQSNWIFDNLKTAVPANALFTDTNTNTQLTTAQVRGKISASGNASYNSTTGVITSTNTNTNQLTTFTISGSDTSGTATIGQGENITFNSGTNMTITRAGNVVSFTSAYTNTNTTYSAGTNMSLSGTTFSSTNTTYSAGSNMSLSGTTFSATNTNTNLLSGGTCSGNLNVTGTLTVGGSTTTLNTATLTVDDPFVVVGDGGTSDGGITVDHTTTTARGHMIWDASSNRWVVSKGTSPATTVTGTSSFNANVATISVVAGTAPTGGVSDGCGIGSFWLSTTSGNGTLYCRVGNVVGGG